MNNLKEELRYIADSPPQEHGGFHPRVVEAAKGALQRIEELEQCRASIFAPTEP